MISQQIHATQERQCMPSIPLIAIVDDDDALRNSLDNLLRSVGFRVQGFSSAEAFLQANQAHETACLILDVRMAGMNGLELQRQLVAANWRIPIIFVTAYADDDARERALAAGAVAFLYKPCREEDLLSAIDATLKHS
jgi:FixJ family two-component response regulator